MSAGFPGSGGGLLQDTTRKDLELAWNEREAEAGLLLAQGHELSSLAFRVYSLEIRVKAMICRRLALDLLPRHCKTHDLSELILFTGLWGELNDS